ncbi:MAG: helix-turn-helix transcriptional regulator [Myxococcales bacterium]|nr:helix-turn-helix transcriptional regulator [Myxococcales bacterium]
MGDGASHLVRRPACADDDSTDVLGIALSDDAALATLELASGRSVQLRAGQLAQSQNGHDGSAIPALDGTQLGARLRELRLLAGLTQAELARRTGIHRPNIARVEAGRHTPSLETLSRLATAIGVSTTTVFSSD